MNNILMKGFISLVLVSALHAETTSCDSINASIDALDSSVKGQQALVSKLSDDIGVMADRIGTMADRIVVTEKLLADTLIVLTNNTDTTNAVVLLEPMDSTVVSKNTPPKIKISSNSTTYLLYASTSPTFDAGKTVVLYIDSDTALKNSWTRATSLGNTIYIAVKSIDDNVISGQSNGVKLTLQ